MTKNASDLLLPRVRPFTVGFVCTDPPAPSVLGSGVLVSIGPLSGILTCAHVAEGYRNRTEIGLLRFSRDNDFQMQKLALEHTQTVYISEGVSDENPQAFDLAFTVLPPDIVGTLNATCVFLNWELNVKKFAGGEPESDRHVDAAFGLIGMRSGTPVSEKGLITTPMRAELTPGHIVRTENGTMTLECTGL